MRHSAASREIFERRRPMIVTNTCHAEAYFCPAFCLQAAIDTADDRPALAAGAGFGLTLPTPLVALLPCSGRRPSPVREAMIGRGNHHARRRISATPPQLASGCAVAAAGRENAVGFIGRDGHRLRTGGNALGLATGRHHSHENTARTALSFTAAAYCHIYV